VLVVLSHFSSVSIAALISLFGCDSRKAAIRSPFTRSANNKS
jgi:hypothetical protein